MPAVKLVAGCKGLEPSTFCVTGRRSKPAELTPQSETYLIPNYSKNQALFSQIDKGAKVLYNVHMKRIFILICMIVLCAIVLGGCGVKSTLEHDPNYPRNYPVY